MSERSTATPLQPARAPGKDELRRALRARRAARDEAQRAAVSRAVEAGAVALARGHRVVAAFVPVGDEPRHGRLLDLLHAVGATVLLPVLRDDLDLDWAAYEPGGLAPGRVRPSLQEPTGPRLGLEAVSEAGLVLVPALAVARDGTRLGFGAGSYDRALRRVEGDRLVAVVHDDEVLGSLPREPHDIRVAHALMPTGAVALDEAASGAPGSA